MIKRKTIIIMVLLIALAIFGTKLSIIPINFAGFSFSDSGIIKEQCNSGNSNGDATIDSNGYLIMNFQSSNINSYRQLTTDVSKIDELLVIYDGFTQCSGSQSGSEITVGIIDDNGQNVGVSHNGCSVTHKPTVSKFRNNFDGTWSSLDFLGVGDIFIAKDTRTIGQNAKLFLKTGGGSACGLAGSASNTLRVYNIIRKENGVAVCKADEILLNNQCQKLSSILLNREEAIYESVNEKIQRLTSELENKNAGLQSQITALQTQLQNNYNSDLLSRVNSLQSELEQTKQQLAAVKARDPVIINTVELQEKFKNPNFFNQILDNIISFFMSIVNYIKSVV